MRTGSTVATAPGALPLLGHTLSLLRSPLRFLTSLSAHGDRWTSSSLSKTAVTTGPESACDESSAASSPTAAPMASTVAIYSRHC